MAAHAAADPAVLSAACKALAVEILVHGAQSRGRLGTRMGLSPATVTRLVKPLLETGVLVESDAVRTQGRGRSSLALDVVPERYRFIGVKLTAESLYAVVTDLRANILRSQVLPLGSLGVADVVSAVGTVVATLGSHSEVPVAAVGVTVGGQVHAGEIVTDSPFLHWHDVPFRSLLAGVLRAPVHLDNDVVGLTCAQHWFGHGRGYPDFALLTVGAGIGYGLVVNDTVVPTSVGPISHFPLDPSGPSCPVGHRGCMTALLASDSITSAVSAGHGRPVGYDEVLDLAAAGDPVAGLVVSQAARALGRAASAISCLTGVRRVILSGEGVHLAETAREAVDQGLSEYDVPGMSHAELVIRPMDFLEWARGAAVLAIQAEFPRTAAAAAQG